MSGPEDHDPDREALGVLVTIVAACQTLAGLAERLTDDVKLQKALRVAHMSATGATLRLRLRVRDARRAARRPA